MATSFSLSIQQQKFSTEQLRQLEPYPARFNELSIQIIHFCKDWLNGQDSFVVHTSGSTGQPKAIILSRRQMQASARQTLQALGIEPGNNALLCINPAYIGGKMMLVRAMEGNLALTAVEAEADPLAQLPAESKFSFIALVPLQLETILQNNHSKKILQRSEAVIIGGAPVSTKLREKLQDIEAPLYSTYGMTETVSHIALQRLNGPEAVDYFTAFPEIQLSQDRRGCLIIEGEVCGGEKVVTNDVVHLQDPHRFQWIGRADNIINSGGVKIQLEKIDALAEQLLLQCGHSRNIFSWGIPDERLGQKLVLFVEGAPLPKEVQINWQKLLEENFVKYEQAKAVFYVTKFCQTPSGKIQKAATASLFSKT